MKKNNTYYIIGFFVLGLISLFCCNKGHAVDRDYIAKSRPDLAVPTLGAPEDPRINKLAVALAKGYSQSFTGTNKLAAVAVNTGEVNHLVQQMLDNQVEALVIYRTPSWGEDWAFAKRTFHTGPALFVIAYDGAQEIYLMVDPVKVDGRWGSFAKFVRSDKGQQIVRDQGFTTIAYKDRT